MNHDELRDWIPALALNALPRREQFLVETHISQCVGCSLEYSQYREVAALLAHLAPAVAPPPALWERIEEGLTQDPPTHADDAAHLSPVIHLPQSTQRHEPTGRPQAPSHPRSPASIRTPEHPRMSEHAQTFEKAGATGYPKTTDRFESTGRRRLPRLSQDTEARSAPRAAPRRGLSFTQRIAALAAAAIVVLGGASVVLLQRPEGHSPQDTYEAILRGPHTTVPLRSTAPSQKATGAIVVSPSGKMAVAIHDLPAAGTGVYTMWLMADGQARSLGDFRPDASREATVAPARTVGQSLEVVVTLESRSGNTYPTGPPVLRT